METKRSGIYALLQGSYISGNRENCFGFEILGKNSHLHPETWKICLITQEKH